MPPGNPGMAGAQRIRSGRGHRDHDRSRPGLFRAGHGYRPGGAVDGFAVAAKVRRVSPRHPVVYITGRPWVFEERFFDEAERTLAKPFRADDLLSAIRDIAPCLGAVR